MRQFKTLFLPHPLDSMEKAIASDVYTVVSERRDLSVFDRDDVIEPQFQGFEAIVDAGGNIRPEWVGVAARAGVKFIQAQTNGLDDVEVEKILDAGIILAHCPGELSKVSLAEQAMLFILLLARRYGEAQRNFEERKLYEPLTMELEGRSVAIVGFGASGQELARRARAFGMRVLAIDVREIEQDVLDELQPEFLGRPDDLDRVISECDFLSVHLHLTEETRHVIDARRLALLKPTACVVNVARGELIDEEALAEALLAGRLGGAGLDTFAEEPADPTLPVLQLPNVYATPHVSGVTDGTGLKRAVFAADNLDRYARGEPVWARVEKR